MDGWVFFLSAGAALLASHAVPSLPPVRAALLGWLGARLFFVLYGLLSTAALAALVLAYVRADMGPQLFVPAETARWLALGLMPLAVFLVVCRLSTPARQGQGLAPPRGIFRITRAPGSLAILLWAALHMANTGDARRLVLFALMAAIALWAIVKNEVVLRYCDEPLAGEWKSKTGLVPFTAGLAAARTAAREIGWLRPALALAGFAAILLLHPLLLGADPLAGLAR